MEGGALAQRGPANVARRSAPAATCRRSAHYGAADALRLRRVGLLVSLLGFQPVRNRPAGAKSRPGGARRDLYLTALGERHPGSGAVSDDDVVVHGEIQ